MHLINCGEDINGKKSITAKAPIHSSIDYTVKAKDDSMLKTIIKCGADLNIVDANGWTALHHACEKGDIKVIEILISENVIVNAYSNKGYYPIHIAALNNHPSIIRYLY